MDENKTNKRVIFRPHAIPKTESSTSKDDLVVNVSPIIQTKKIKESKTSKDKKSHLSSFVFNSKKSQQKNKDFVPKPVGIELSSNSHYMQLNPTFDDDIILKISPTSLSKEDIFYIRNVIKKININDVKTSIDFGIDIQEEIRELTQNILLLNKYDTTSINNLFKDLFQFVSSVNENDLTGIKGGIRGKLHAIMSGISTKEHIFITINQVNKIAEKIEKELPSLLECIDNITEIEKTYLLVNKKLKNYIIAGRVIILLLEENKKNILNKNNKDAFSSKFIEIRNIDSSIESITKRINSLLLTFENEEIGDMQINLLKENYIDLINFSRETILGLATRWKSQCISTISMAETGLQNSFNAHVETFSLIKEALCRELKAKLNS